MILLAAGDVDASVARQVALGCEPGASHPFANFAVAGLGHVARARGDPEAALPHYRGALEQARRFGNSTGVACDLGGVAGALAAAGRWEAAARMFGAAEALHEAAGAPFGLETFDRQQALGLPEPWLRAGAPFERAQVLRDALGDRVTSLPAVPDPATAGRLLTLEQAVTEALAYADGESNEAIVPSPPVPIDGFRLSKRERQILALLAQRLTDPEIAEQLFLSVCTVEGHVSHIFNKLGVGNRREAAALAVRTALV